MNWRRIGLIASADPEGSIFVRTVGTFVKPEKLYITETVWIHNDGDVEKYMREFQQLLRSKVDAILVHCNTAVSSKIFELFQVNAGTNITWIVTEGTLDVRDLSTHKLPLGLLKLKYKNKGQLHADLVFDAMGLFDAAIQKSFGDLCSDGIRRQCSTSRLATEGYSSKMQDYTHKYVNPYRK